MSSSPDRSHERSSRSPIFRDQRVAVFLGALLACDDAEIDQQREVVRCNSGERCSDCFRLQHLDRSADEDMIEPQKGSAARKGWLPARRAEPCLGVAKMRSQPLLDARIRSGVEVACDDDRLTTGRMSKPIGTKQRIDLPKSVRPRQAKMCVENLDLGSGDIYRCP